jgi:hypothetical protein
MDECSGGPAAAPEHLFGYGRLVGLGFSYLLVLEGGEPADPAAFLTAIPN